MGELSVFFFFDPCKKKKKLATFGDHGWDIEKNKLWNYNALWEEKQNFLEFLSQNDLYSSLFFKIADLRLEKVAGGCRSQVLFVVRWCRLV